MALYRITLGEFRLPDNTTLGAGQTIELDDDVAKLHPDMVTLADPPAPPSPDEPVPGG